MDHSSETTGGGSLSVKSTVGFSVANRLIRRLHCPAFETSRFPIEVLQSSVSPLLPSPDQFRDTSESTWDSGA